MLYNGSGAMESMSNFSRRSAYLFVFSIVITLATTSFGRPQPTALVNVQAVLKAARALESVPVSNFPVDVPVKARPLLTSLKHSLCDLITGEIGAHPSDGASALQARMTEILGHAGILHHNLHNGNGYAQVGSVQITQPPGHPNLLAAVTTLDIPCGQDSSLYVYQQAGHAWRLVLAVEANNYSQIDGALSEFQYRVSPSNYNGRWFVVTANVDPWCSSAWHSLHFQVLRPSGSAYHPKTILATSRFAYEGYNDLDKLAVSAYSFTIVYYTSQSLDAGVLIRIGVDRYRIVGDRAMRARPLALYPEDFLDLWVDSPWQEAKEWTALTVRSAAQSWHKTLSQVNDPKTKLYTNFDFVQPCPEPETWQVALVSEAAPKSQGEPSDLYFTITRKGGKFMVRGVGIYQPPGCPGQAHPARRLEPLPDPSTMQ